MLLGLLAFPVLLIARPVLHNLEIEVVLNDNGDADITELRQMTIDDVGTECYIVIGNLRGSEIRDFRVTDEQGRDYVNVGEWDVDRSRLQKAGRCGIVTKSNGYELCWGLGNSGERNYLVKYTVTKLVRSYDDSDGFNHMFVARDISPAPQKATVTIKAPWRNGGLPEDSVKVWSFGYHGDILKLDSIVEASTNEPLGDDRSMIVMMELDKGILHPVRSEYGKFSNVREKAFENSDYKEKTTVEKIRDAFFENIVFLSYILLFVLLFFFLVWNWYKRKKARKELLETLDWYREIPVNGDLVRARGLYNAFYMSGGISANDLISAMILRLIRVKALRVEMCHLDATGLKKIFGSEGKDQECIVVYDYDTSNRLVNSMPIRKLYNIFLQASGEDRILQPKELKKWFKRNKSEVMDFLNSIDVKVGFKEAKNNLDDVRKVYGLKKFLEDFTLANERNLSEVSLWKDYLVYATLFGIADQVREDMQKLNPEYLNMDEILKTMNNPDVVPVLVASTLSSTRSARIESTRSSGGGGSSSFGGGGGFSGGGSGGGVR